MTTLQNLRAATLEARRATGMEGIGTRVDTGRVQVVLFSRQGNRVIADPLSDYVSLSEAVATLRQITADKGFRA